MKDSPSRHRQNSNGPEVPKFRGEKRKRYEALLSLRDELYDQVKDLSSSSLVNSREAGEDLADIGSDNFSRDMGLTLMSEEGKRIALIQDAIQRLIEGDYGECIDCGTKIGSGRLDAIPYAKLCIKCKTFREDNEGMPPEGGSEELTE